MIDRTVTGLAGRFVLASMLSGLLAAAMIWLIGQHERELQLQQQADGLGNTLARQTAIMSTELVLANDLISLNVLLNELTRDTPVAQVEVLGVDDRIIASAGNQPADSERMNRYLAPIALQDSMAGYVRLTLGRNLTGTAAAGRAWMMPAALLLVLTLSASATLLLYRHHVGLPLQALTARLQAMRRGQAQPCTIGPCKGEVAQLIETYNRLVPEAGDEVAETSPTTSRADEQTHGGGTVLTLRFDNHDEWQGELPAETVAEADRLCRQWLDQVATLYNGHLIRHAGDSFALRFGYPAHDREQVFHALCSALLFIRLCRELPACLSVSLEPRIQAGVHCATDSRATVDPLRMADQLCAHAPDNTLLFSTVVLEQAQSPERLEFEAHAQIPVPDTDETMDSWQLTGLAAPRNRDLIERQASQLLNQTT